ncbi:MAG: flagellar biosynthetic protein FliQ [Thermoleophilia bacterium]|nr:flagellar biosynthetic protein FliQ [Thermoleophilia bacterium]
MEGLVIDVGRTGLYVAFLITLPVFVFAFGVGLVISLFQASTQIHEQTMTFIPKMLAVGVALLVFGPWMLKTLVEFATSVLARVAALPA